MGTSKRRAVKPTKAITAKSKSKAASRKAPKAKSLVERGTQRRVVQERRQLPPAVCDNCGKAALLTMLACQNCGNTKAV